MSARFYEKFDLLSQHLLQASKLIEELRTDLAASSEQIVHSDHRSAVQVAQKQTSIAIGTERYTRIPYKATSHLPVTCSDCGTEPDHYHILGCMNEVCPKCLTVSLLACNCYSSISNDQTTVV